MLPSGSAPIIPALHDTRVPERRATSPGKLAPPRTRAEKSHGFPAVITVIFISVLFWVTQAVGASPSYRASTPRQIATRSVREFRVHTVSPRPTSWRPKRHAHHTNSMLAATCVPSKPSRPAVAATVSTTPKVLEAVREAVEATKLDPVLLLTLARAESSFDPSARNRLSTARGLLQFTRDAWLETVRQFGPRHGLSGYADAISSNRAGHLYTAHPATLRAILRLRDNPQLSAVMAAERIAQQRLVLERVLGHEASVTDLYLLHVLGQHGVTRFLTALQRNPALPSVNVIGASTQRNAGLFMRGGCPLTVGQIYTQIGTQMLAERDEYRPVLANLSASISGSAP